jgi:putative membrane protein
MTAVGRLQNGSLPGGGGTRGKEEVVMKRSMIFGACLAVVLAAPLWVMAEMPSSDAKFMKKAAEGSQAEAALGKLATERGGSDAVKKFGERMVADHGKANDELVKLAQDKGVTLPSSLEAKHKRLHARLAKLSGADFDREYMREMVRDHDADVKEFEREAKSAKDPDLKSWIGKTLPTLKEHQQQAREVNAGVSGKTKSAATPR